MNGLKGRVVGLRLPHYLLAGGLTVSTEYTSFLMLFYVMRLSGLVANTVSFLVALGVSFGLNKLWVFQAKTHGRWRKQLILYGSLGLFNLIATNAALGYLLSIGVAGFAAKFLVIGAVASWNFVLFRRVIFKKGDVRGGSDLQ